jgi:hypothetical protein
VWTVLVFYNMTEAAFGGGLLWMTLLTGAISLPLRAKDRVLRLAKTNNSGTTEQLSTTEEVSTFLAGTGGNSWVR